MAGGGGGGGGGGTGSTGLEGTASSDFSQNALNTGVPGGQPGSPDFVNTFGGSSAGGSPASVVGSQADPVNQAAMQGQVASAQNPATTPYGQSSGPSNPYADIGKQIGQFLFGSSAQAGQPARPGGPAGADAGHAGWFTDYPNQRAAAEARGQSGQGPGHWYGPGMFNNQPGTAPAAAPPQPQRAPAPAAAPASAPAPATTSRAPSEGGVTGPTKTVEPTPTIANTPEDVPLPRPRPEGAPGPEEVPLPRPRPEGAPQPTAPEVATFDQRFPQITTEEGATSITGGPTSAVPAPAPAPRPTAPSYTPNYPESGYDVNPAAQPPPATFGQRYGNWVEADGRTAPGGMAIPPATVPPQSIPAAGNTIQSPSPLQQLITGDFPGFMRSMLGQQGVPENQNMVGMGQTGPIRPTIVPVSPVLAQNPAQAQAMALGSRQISPGDASNPALAGPGQLETSVTGPFDPFTQQVATRGTDMPDAGVKKSDREDIKAPPSSTRGGAVGRQPSYQEWLSARDLKDTPKNKTRYNIETKQFKNLRNQATPEQMKTIQPPPSERPANKFPEVRPGWRYPREGGLPQFSPADLPPLPDRDLLPRGVPVPDPGQAPYQIPTGPMGDQPITPQDVQMLRMLQQSGLLDRLRQRYA